MFLKPAHFLEWNCIAYNVLRAEKFQCEFAKLISIQTRVLCGEKPVC